MSRVVGRCHHDESQFVPEIVIIFSDGYEQDRPPRHGGANSIRSDSLRALPEAYFICRSQGGSLAEWPKDSHECAPTPTCGVISCPRKAVDTECRPPTVARVSKRPKKLRAISRACPRRRAVRERRRGGELLSARRTLFQVDVFEQRSDVDGVSERPAEPNPSTSPQTPGETSGAAVDATLALDELVRRLGNRLVCCGVAHKAAPLASGPRERRTGQHWVATLGVIAIVSAPTRTVK
jgi:hypothetical protein